nr:MAG TPA: hypothetical protein [Caudoviricetes sp.]
MPSFHNRTFFLFLHVHRKNGTSFSVNNKLIHITSHSVYTEKEPKHPRLRLLISQLILRSGSSLSRGVVIDSESLEASHSGISNSVTLNGILQFAIFTTQTFDFKVSELAVNQARLTLKAQSDSGSVILKLTGQAAFHSLKVIGGTFLHQTNFGSNTINLTGNGIQITTHRAAAFTHGVTHVAGSVIGTIALIAHGSHNFSNRTAQLRVKSKETIGRSSLGSGNTVVQTDNALTVVASHFGKGGLIASAEVIPATTSEQEQQQEHKHEHTFTTEGTVITTLTAQSHQTGQVHILIALHQSKQTSNVIRIRVLIIIVRSFSVNHQLRRFNMITTFTRRSHVSRGLLVSGLFHIVTHWLLLLVNTS